MPRIGDIALKDPITSTDNLLGSDSTGVPHNFDIDVVKDYIIDEVKTSHLSVGIIDTSVPTFTDNGDGTGTIAGCNAALRDNANHTGYVVEYAIPEETFTFVDGAQEYIVINYNSGDPIYTKENSPVGINGSDLSLVYVVWRTGLKIHVANQDSVGLGLSNKTNARLLNVEPHSISSLGGLLISETTDPADRTILVSSAIVYSGIVPVSVSSFDSSTDSLYKVVQEVGGGWSYTLVTQYNNSHYNPTNLGEVVIDNSKWIFNLYYRSICDEKEVFFIESEKFYNSTAEARSASEAGRSSTPSILKSHCLLVGRSIIQKNITTGETTSFVRTRGDYTTFIPNHNELPNIQGGSETERYHTTEAQNTIITNLPKIGDIDNSNYTEFESDGTMVAVGDAVCWNDIFLAAGSLGAGASAPDLVNVNSTGIFLYAFDGSATTEQLFGCFEIPHNYREGSDLVPHIHWMPTTTGTGNVKWNIDFWRVNENDVPSVATSISAVGTTTGTAWQSRRSDTTSILGPGVTIGNQVAFRLYRTPADVQDTYAADAVVMTFGIHYQIDTLGSRQITTK